MPINDSISEINEALDTLRLAETRVEPTIIIVKDTIVKFTESGIEAKSEIANQPLDLNISPIVIIAIIGFGVGLYFLMAFLRKYILPVFVQRYQKLTISLFWYRFTCLIWLAFGIIALYVFLKGSVIITSIIIVAAGAIFHNFIFDFMVGVYFQFENHIKLKMQLKQGDLTGEVHSFQTRHLKIVDSKGEEIYLPYRNLLNSPVRIIKQIDSLAEKSFIISIPGNPVKGAQMIQKYMTMCPWIHDSNLYKVVHLNDQQFQVNVRVKENFTANKIESFIQSKIR